jgi:hypothetical protein
MSSDLCQALCAVLDWQRWKAGHLQGVRSWAWSSPATLLYRTRLNRLPDGAAMIEGLCIEELALRMQMVIGQRLAIGGEEMLSVFL